MIEYNTWLQTVAAISSAIAAIAAVYVAKKTFTFHRNSLLKKANVEHILKLLQQLHYLKSLTAQVALGAADDEFTGLTQRILELKANVKTLESMTSAPASADLLQLRDFVGELRDANVFAHDVNTLNVATSQQLDGAINALHKIYRSEIK